MKEIDARGLVCPKPLMMAKEALDADEGPLAVLVSNEAAVKNLSHLAARLGREVEVEEADGEWTLSFSALPEGACPAAEGSEGDGDYAVFVGKDHVGEGDETLGRSLMKMALYTLSEAEEPPAFVLFMNGGVSLVAGDEQQIIDNVSSLIARGTEVLVCGTCLDYYGLSDSLKVGEVSNMYDILGAMQRSSKVISL